MAFAHPLVEAMASGLPIVASDLPVHREIADGAAVFFARCSPTELADRISQLLDSPLLISELKQKGVEQSHKFSWKKHVEQLLGMAETLVGKQENTTEQAR